MSKIPKIPVQVDRRLDYDRNNKIQCPSQYVTKSRWNFNLEMIGIQCTHNKDDKLFEVAFLLSFSSILPTVRKSTNIPWQNRFRILWYICGAKNAVEHYGKRFEILQGCPIEGWPSWYGKKKVSFTIKIELIQKHFYSTMR